MSTRSKGNILESLTEILELSLSDTETQIFRNKKITDLDGITREIDIYIETKINKRKFNIVIECKNYKKDLNINIDHIGAFYEKCNRLPNINKLIFLTTSDYQEGAITKAKSRNIELYRITSESIEGKSGLDVKSISIIERDCKLLSMRFNSSELFQAKIYTDEKLPFVDGKNRLVSYNELKDKISKLPEIWRFLYTESGLLLNHKKKIFPNIKTQNLFTNFKGNLFQIDDVQLTLEIELKFKPLNFENVKKYESLTDNKTLATFSDIEFVVDGKSHRVCYVEPIDSEEGKFFVSNSKQIIELKTFDKFESSPQPLELKASSVINIKINEYKFKMSKKAMSNSIPVAPKENNPKFLANIKSKKSTIIVAIDAQSNYLYFMIPFTHNNKLMTAKFPEPITLFFNHAIDLHKKGLYFREIMVKNTGENAQIILQDDSYNKYLQYNISSIFMLHACIELFINSCIKDNFKENIEGEPYNKKKVIENFSLREKIEFIVPLISDFEIDKNLNIAKPLLKLNELNEEFQNLETSDSINQPFLKSFEDILKFDMENCIKMTKLFFKKVDRNFRLIEQ